ncbi:putative outer membrane starch-binding protein [Chitinophaga skermanii]|uniref:Putative outer membrane starch-binding protein n=1 Tax=Chitinophaga skermanii TaxID=331697 RepID=A0A327R378_9BACT|nr:RagB/SusD family nutrient uptake outer membrane protein [Chitinophaga skermanii]RAJ10675.1 putative outer membrane starch-binding protein [Chitinophaga skermanii]
MKRSFYICLVTMLSVMALPACNKEFLDRYPLDKITDNTFWKSGNDLEIYVNSFYPKYIIGFSDAWADGTVAPYGVNAAILPYGDVISDNAAPNSYARVSANQYNAHLSGAAGSGGWNYANIRALNYFIDNYEKAPITPAEKNVYLGEVYCFKAWDYFEKVKLFGDVSWLSHSLQTNSPELYAARTPRGEVMDSVMALLDKAIAMLPIKGAEKSGRLNKDMALFLKARVGLHEGTYRKYHTDLKLDPTAYLKAAADASEELINSGRYALKQGTTSSVYFDLFATESYKGNTEIILAKEYSATLNYGAAFSRYFAQNLRHQFGATRSLVDEYLCTDGLTISTSPLFKGKDSIQAEFTNRDPRLTQTIANFGTYNLAVGVTSGADNAPKPNIPGLSGNKCPTGYRVAKWFYNNPVDWDRITNGMQAAPVFRYAEILLTYAEAKYEQGAITQTIIDKTINALRARVGMPGLTIGQEPADTRLDNIYHQYLSYPVAPLLREIRRERRVEMAFENTRWHDLMRWKAGRLLEVPVEGIKFVQAQFPKVVINKDVYLSSEGFLLPYYKTLPTGRTFDENKQYLFPIPIADIVLNKNLGQNPGWEQP